jgi:hypothetical protein
MSSKSQSCLSVRTIAGSFSASSKSSLRRGASRAIRSLRTPPIVACRQRPLPTPASLLIDSPWGAFAISTGYVKNKKARIDLVKYVDKVLMSFLTIQGWLRAGGFGSLGKKDARLRTTCRDRVGWAFYSPGSTETPGSILRLLTIGLSGFSLLQRLGHKAGCCMGRQILGAIAQLHAIVRACLARFFSLDKVTTVT